VQANAALAELRAEGDEVQDGAPEPIEPRDLQRVAVAKQLEQLVELRAAGLGAARAVDVDRVLSDARAQKGVALADTLETLLAQRARRSVAGAAVEGRGRSSSWSPVPSSVSGVEPRRRRARDSVDAVRARARVDGTPKLTPRQAKTGQDVYDELGADGHRARRRPADLLTSPVSHGRRSIATYANPRPVAARRPPEQATG